MNKTIISHAAFIQPGKPLLITGPYGCGKLTAAMMAVKSLGLEYKLIHFGLCGNDNYLVNEIKSILQSLYNNTVIIFDEIQYVNNFSVYSDLIVNQMSNPERRVILTGTHCNNLAINSKVSNRIQMIGFSDL